MKRAIFIVSIILLWIGNALAMPPAICGTSGEGPAGAADFCSTCTGESDADIACEDFEGTGYFCSSNWSEVVGGNGSVDEDASHSGSLVCTDKGSQALEVLTSTSTAAYALFDNGSETTELEFVWYFNPKETSGITNGTNSIAGTILDGSNNQMLYYRVEQVSGQQRILVRTKNNSDTWDDGTVYNITANNWYRMRGNWVDGSPGTWDVWIANDDGTSETKVVNGAEAHTNYEFQRARFGSNSSESEQPTFQWDNIKLDDDTMPGYCSTS